MGLLDVLLPPACSGCGTFGDVFCRSCRASLRPASDRGSRFFAPDPGVVVGSEFRVAVAAFIYEGAVRRALQRLKYGGVARVAAPLAEAAVPALRGLVMTTGALPIAAVPLHPARQRERGYNQAELLARELAARAGLPFVDLLVRTRSTVKQHKLDRAGRARNLAAAFALRPNVRAPPAVLVVDDIMTTGATLEACASVLRAAGVSDVYGFTLAREV